MMKNLKKKKKGFTLIELIIVIAIIAILAAIAVPKFGEVRKNANKSADVANAKTIQSAVTALIAEGKINLPSSAVPFELDNKSVSADEQAVIDYLQGALPKAKLSKYSGKYFTVDIDSTGKVTIKVDTAIVYPQPTTATADYAE